jgi:tRNA A-37 threonylcarbamoyl transferase component Bud32
MIISEATDTRYDIVKLLGQGASATVYLARHIALGELRVLKILHHDMMLDPRRREKFKMEAQVSAHLKHPAIVQVFDVTQTHSKLQIEMEYIDGMSLRQYLEKRKHFPLSVALAITYAVLEGMEHAHKARLTFGETALDGVIHRDLKPENILLRRNGQPVICDFGVAKVGADLMTQTQHISGSVAYMAPERLRGELSTRSIDVFALGVMLFELHKGYRPFPGGNKAQVLENILKWNLVDMDAAWKGSDEAVLEVAKKAMAREPAQRYQDAGQMLAALRTIYKLYHGDAPPAAVVQDYLARGHFTTAEFRALMPEETPWRTRLLKVGAGAGVAVAAGLVWMAVHGSPRPGASAKAASVPAAADIGPGIPKPLGGPAKAEEASVARKQASPVSTAPAGQVNTTVTPPLPVPSPAEAENQVRAMPPEARQGGYYALAKSALQAGGDPGRALLLVNKALDYSYHPTIALLKVEILQDQDMFNLAGGELERVRPWLPRLTRENQAQYYWLSAQQQLRRGGTAGPKARARAKYALRRYLALNPKGSEENLKSARQELRALP